MSDTIKSGSLVWVKYHDGEDAAFDYTGIARVTMSVGESVVCNTGKYGKCLFPFSSLRVIATPEEIKQRTNRRNK